MRKKSENLKPELLNGGIKYEMHDLADALLEKAMTSDLIEHAKLSDVIAAQRVMNDEKKLKISTDALKLQAARFFSGMLANAETERQSLP